MKKAIDLYLAGSEQFNEHDYNAIVLKCEEAAMISAHTGHIAMEINLPEKPTKALKEDLTNELTEAGFINIYFWSEKEYEDLDETKYKLTFFYNVEEIPGLSG